MIPNHYIRNQFITFVDKIQLFFGSRFLFSEITNNLYLDTILFYFIW